MNRTELLEERFRIIHEISQPGEMQSGYVCNIILLLYIFLCLFLQMLSVSKSVGFFLHPDNSLSTPRDSRGSTGKLQVPRGNVTGQSEISKYPVGTSRVNRKSPSTPWERHGSIGKLQVPRGNVTGQSENSKYPVGVKVP